MDWTANQVLGEVLRRAREALGRSPEQVGAIVGVAGRTIRRLEAGESDRPRRVTLDGLAGFYGLDQIALSELAEASDSPSELLTLLRKEVAARTAPEVVEALEGVDDEAVELAMRWARSRPSTSVHAFADDEQDRLLGLLNDLRVSSPNEHRNAVESLKILVALDRTRRTLALGLLRDLRLAQEAQLRPRTPRHATLLP